MNVTNDNSPNLLLLLGKMDGKLDNVLLQLTTLTNRADNHEREISLIKASMAVLEREAEHSRTIGNEVDSIKLTLEGRADQLNQTRQLTREVDDLKSWALSQRAETVGQVKTLNFLKEYVLPIALGFAGALGFNAVQYPHDQPVHPPTEAKVNK